MFGSETLEVAIGLAFMFFILSLMLTSAREILEGWLQTRAIHLERGVRELLKDETGEGLARDLYGHPLVSSLFRGDYKPESLTGRILRRNDPWKRIPFRSNLPAYIPARNFATALLDLSARGSPDQGSSASLTVDQIREGVSVRIASPHVRRAVLLAIDNAKGDIDQVRAGLEAWFDSGMDRVSGWYRKETQGILLVMGLLVAWGLNIDSLHVARTLIENDARRTVIVTEAAAVVDRVKAQGAGTPDQAAMLSALGCARDSAQPVPAPVGKVGPATAPATAGAGPGSPQATTAPGAPAAGPQADLSCAERRVRDLGYPVGWNGRKILWSWLWPGNFQTWSQWWTASQFPWQSVPGWIITALAISLGAPFWFDLLNKMMVIRSTVKPHEKSPEEASEDRQPRSAVTAAPDSPAPNAGQPAPNAVQAVPAPRADDPLFRPHQWAGRTDPQEGDL